VSEHLYPSPTTVWRDAVANYAARLDQLRIAVRVALGNLTYTRHATCIDVQDEDIEHVRVVVGELRERGWVVALRGTEMVVQIPEETRNPPRAG